MYVIKYKDWYCKFGSYRKTDFVNTPQQANLYGRSRDARKRIENTLWHDGEIINPNDLAIYCIDFDYEEFPLDSSL